MSAESPPSPVGPRRILVATDFSENAQYALDYARVVAHAAGAKIVLHHSMHCPEPHTMVGGAFKPLLNYTELHGEVERQLQAEARRAKVGQMLEAVDVGRYRPDVEILKAAHAHNCDLVVLGTQGRRGVSRFVMGSVSERVSRESRIPVLVIPMPSAD